MSLPVVKAFGARMMDSKTHGDEVGAITLQLESMPREPEKICAYVSYRASAKPS